MRNFFGRYGYSMVKMFVNQFAVSLFGMVLSLATAGEDNKILMIVAGVFAVVLYLFLIYTMTWEIGAKDKISNDYGKTKKRPYLGFVLSLIANIPNIIIATVYTVLCLAVPAADLAFMRMISFFFVGMYQGFLSAIELGGVQLFEFWWSYFIIIIPAVLTAGLAYFLGTKNAHFTSIVETQYPDSDREPKKKWFGKDK